jgi:hypothetical protein
MPRQLEMVQIGALKVDSRLLEEQPVAWCREGTCPGSCCGYGVVTDLAEASRIVEEADLIAPHLGRDSRDPAAWFVAEVKEDRESPSGYSLRTQVRKAPDHPTGTRCIFLRFDYRCGLQVTSAAAGRHPWDLKPFNCAIYPLTLVEDRLYLDDDSQMHREGHGCLRREAPPTPLYVLLRRELTHALGQQGYDQLCALARGRSGVDLCE